MMRIVKSLAMLAMLAALILGGGISSVAAQDDRPGGQGSKVVTPQSHSVCDYVSDSYRPTLRRGSTGAAVKQVQCLINYYSFYPTWLDEDGKFGPRTETAVRWVQDCANITIDGVVGPVTWGVLYNQPPACGVPT